MFSRTLPFPQLLLACLTVYKARGHRHRLGLSTLGRPRALPVLCSLRWVTFDPRVRSVPSVPHPRGAFLTLWPVNTIQMLPPQSLLPTLSKARSCTFSKAMERNWPIMPRGGRESRDESF